MIYSCSFAIAPVELKPLEFNPTLRDSKESSVWFKSLSHSQTVRHDRFTDNWIEVERKQ